MFEPGRGHSPGGEVGHRSWVLRASWPDSSGLGFVLNLLRIPGGVLAKESPRSVFSERAHRLLPGQSAFGEAREAGSVSEDAVSGRWSGGGLGVCFAA